MEEWGTIITTITTIPTNQRVGRGLKGCRGLAKAWGFEFVLVVGFKGFRGLVIGLWDLSVL